MVRLQLPPAPPIFGTEWRNERWTVHCTSDLRVWRCGSEITAKVLAEQTIDFTRHDASWLIWLLIPPLLLLAGLKRNDFAGGGQSAMRTVFMRLIGGLILGAIVIGLISFWHVSRPQYFIKLRLEEKTIALKYHRSGPETLIPLKDITSLSVVKSGTLRHSCRRLRIETTSGPLHSFGFERLDEDQVAVVEALRQKIAA